MSPARSALGPPTVLTASQGVLALAQPSPSGPLRPRPYLLMALAASPKRAIAQAVRKAMRPTSQYARGR